jgi:UDP:flavonoid glycosyltransferase YjiC (YdhE family)
LSAPVVTFFAMGEEGHFQRMRPLISGVAARGHDALVFTDRRFRREVERCGGQFIDLFERWPLEKADSESLPVPCRFVSFAGTYADEIISEVAGIQPALVIYDTFAVIGQVAGHALGLPYVNVCAGHNVDPARFVPLLRNDPRVDISPRCHEAVEILRQRYGLVDASPFSYVSGLSPFLNVYCEPSHYLSESEKRVFEPIAFFGSLPSLEEIEARGRVDRSPSVFDHHSGALKMYVSFGTVVWRYFSDGAADTLQAIIGCARSDNDISVVISLGRSRVAKDLLASYRGANVKIADYVDQWTALEEADVFVTHNGLNSTHESIFKFVPMISYPFFWDQPSLAGKCRDFGVAIPLSESPRAPVAEEDVFRAITELTKKREELKESLKRAREWELQVMSERDSVVDRITELV